MNNLQKNKVRTCLKQRCYTYLLCKKLISSFFLNSIHIIFTTTMQVFKFEFCLTAYQPLWVI